jgi:uncharacterized protein CbrC (UPF0167 family)
MRVAQFQKKPLALAVIPGRALRQQREGKGTQVPEIVTVHLTSSYNTLNFHCQTETMLPIFRYHPSPISTGSIKSGSVTCDCCGQVRQFEYVASFYTRHTPKVRLCPWCIASGEAARKYKGRFSDDYSLRNAGIAEDIIREVCERTPGYNSWQQETWQSHCGDACEFHGDAELADLRALRNGDLTDLLHRNLMKEHQWQSLLATYRKGGNPAVYKFVCRQCRVPMYSVDFT